MLAGCLPDNPSLDTGETGDTNTDTGQDVVETGLLGCPSGEACTIVAVSQTLDDRVDLFTAAGAGPRYRGSLDLDLDPNLGGDISGATLDEPYGLAWDGDELHVLLGHHPTRELGSLLSFPAAGLSDYEAGARVSVDDWFSGGEATGLGVRVTGLSRTEPLSMLLHPASGDLLISVFANDLMVPDDMWTQPSELLVLTPGAADVQVADPGCAGAWSITALDTDADAVALACDADERVAIFDTSSLAAPTLTCVAQIPFMNKRVRYLAADGLGGVVVGEHPQIVSSSEDARLWWFDGGCQLRGFSVLDGDTSWIVRALALLPSAGQPRWLLARADSDQRGVVVLAGDTDAGSIAQCGRLDGLDEAGLWIAAGGPEPLRPHALALDSEGVGLAIAAGPANYANAGPGYGSVWWTQLDYADEPCDAVALAPIELSDSAPAVDPQLPHTWSRAPDVIHLIEVQG
ncbi:hypothetical protein [Enhygromyxa salina]|uniref:Uncharacterized protein n=1 Tax=Enhygromyxa salina TaxID=215803 RepID=A0A2S9YM87_9BACT|nr:hypothetical protein [Enhygromyxa salina]PRQ06211.1 hypothetical protein ENSA7_40590 [Enhygromyxa salina]